MSADGFGQDTGIEAATRHGSLLRGHHAALLHFGLTHHTAPLEIRELCAADRGEVSDMLTRLREAAEESAILSTCGRFEVYAVSSNSDLESWRSLLGPLSRCPVDRFLPYLQQSRQRRTAHHLLRVSAGLDSQIVGEDHIAHQVRQAFKLAQQAGTCGPRLSALFRAAIHAGRRVRRETDINRVPRSFAHLAVQHFREHWDRHRPLRLLVLGSGFLARDVVQRIGRNPAVHLDIVGRNPQRARMLAEQSGGQAGNLAELERLGPLADAVFACTASPQYLIGPANVRRNAFQFLYDLGMPRNVDPAVRGMEGIRLLQLDDLAPHQPHHDQIVGTAEVIITQELDKLMSWYRRHRKRTPRQRGLGRPDKEGLAA